MSTLICVAIISSVCPRHRFSFPSVTFLVNVTNCEYVSVLHASRMSYINKTLSEVMIIVKTYNI